MPVFTVHAPVDAARRADSDRFVFVRDGFHFWAFLFGPLWFISHRLWLALSGYNQFANDTQRTPELNFRQKSK